MTLVVELWYACRCVELRISARAETGTKEASMQYERQGRDSSATSSGRRLNQKKNRVDQNEPIRERKYDSCKSQC